MVCGDDGISIGLAKLNIIVLIVKKKFPLKDIYFGKKQDINVEGKKVSPTDVAQLLEDLSYRIFQLNQSLVLVIEVYNHDPRIQMVEIK